MLRRALSTVRDLRPARPRGCFPSAAWAWPTGDRDLLLQAAILDDVDAAVAAYHHWQASFDFEQVDFARQRLLVAVAGRIPADHLDADDRARLAGVGRHLWAHCLVSLRAAKPILSAYADAGIEMMIFKGAARSVLDIHNLRGRYASEIDLLVHPADFDRAWQIAIDMGWKKAVAHVNPHDRTGANLSTGSVGEVDLHRYPFHQMLPGDADLATLWARASRHTFLDVEVAIPSPTDRLVLAIAHGGIGSHDQSDWMIDAAQLIRSGEIDWPLFLDLVAERRLDPPAEIALSYLAGPLGVQMPADVLATVAARSRRTPWRAMLAVLEARPRHDHSVASSLGRTLARRLRIAEKYRVIARLEAARPPPAA